MSRKMQQTDVDNAKKLKGNLDSGFNWSSTPQGWEYWNKVSKSLKLIVDNHKRERITIGGNQYYKDELEVALKNINPIK